MNLYHTKDVRLYTLLKSLFIVLIYYFTVSLVEPVFEFSQECSILNIFVPTMISSL